MAETIVSEEERMWIELDRLVLVPGLITGADRAFVTTHNRVPPPTQGHLPWDDGGSELYRIFNLYNDEFDADAPGPVENASIEVT